MKTAKCENLMKCSFYSYTQDTNIYTKEAKDKCTWALVRHGQRLWGGNLKKLLKLHRKSTDYLLLESSVELKQALYPFIKLFIFVVDIWGACTQTASTNLISFGCTFYGTWSSGNFNSWMQGKSEHWQVWSTNASTSSMKVTVTSSDSAEEYVEADNKHSSFKPESDSSGSIKSKLWKVFVGCCRYINIICCLYSSFEICSQCIIVFNQIVATVCDKKLNKPPSSRV